MSGCAWVTLATNDTYCLGALVLAHSLKNVLTRHQLAIIITPQVSPAMREQLSKVFDVIQTVDVLDSQDSANLALLQRPDLGVTFTKIHCWNLTQYSKCVFLDADTLVMQNCDELMEREEMSAAPDPGWPDCFNSGVFVFVPSQETFRQLIQFASTHGSFDGGDQGLLNMYFNDWPTSDIRKHLSFLYNMCSTSTYTYLPALKYYGANIKIVHFIGTNKPWLLGPSGAGMSAFTQAWWDIFQSSVVQHLSKEMREYCTRWRNTAGESSFETNNFSKTIPTEQSMTQARYIFTDPWEKYSDKTDIVKSQNEPPDKYIPKIVVGLSNSPVNYGSPKNDCISRNNFENTNINVNFNNLYRIPNLRSPENKENIHIDTSQSNRKQKYFYRPNDLKKNESNNEKLNYVMQNNVDSLVKATGRQIDINPTNHDNVPFKNKTVCGFVTNGVQPSYSFGSLGSQDNSGLAGALGSKEKSAIEEQWRKQNWEQGNIDFTGKDSFENIWHKIMSAVNKPKVETPNLTQQQENVPIPKEIASQAIPEKEKADIPTPVEGDALLEQIKDAALLPILDAQASPAISESAKPIPVPPPAPEGPKLPDTPQPLQPFTTEPSKTEAPKPCELSKMPEIIPAPLIDEAAMLAQIVGPQKDEPVLTQSEESDALPKIEDILKGLEQTILLAELHSSPAQPTQNSNLVLQALGEQIKDVPQVQALLTDQQIVASPPLPEVPTGETNKTEPALPKGPEVPVVAASVPLVEQPQVPVSQPEAAKPFELEQPKVDATKSEAPAPEVPKPATPTAEAPKPEVPPTTEAAKPATPITEAPIPVAPIAESPIPITPTVEPPKPVTPTAGPPKPEAPIAETPQSIVPPTSEVPKPTTPIAEPPQSATPTAEAPKPMTPGAGVPLSEMLIVDASKPITPESEVLQIDTTKVASVPEVPKAETPQLPLKDSGSAPEILNLEKSKVEIPVSATAPSTQDKKEPSPPQAPQPPPKNGKQKKGQPEPTIAHPLAVSADQPEPGKEQSLTLSQAPLTPPTSPESLVKESEVHKEPGVQPGTPIVTAPTPPVTPLDAAKVEDPLTAQMRSEEAELTGSVSASPDVPVPPKRKGKGNEKQQQKPQNGGGKGKGKK